MAKKGVRVYVILEHLAVHGWITLRSMAPLIGCAHATGIYAKQKTKNPIPVVKIGGQYRVYKDDVIDILENAPEKDKVASQAFLRIYRSYLTSQEQVDE